MNRPSTDLSTPSTPDEFDELRVLLHEYAASIKVDLEFQHFKEEIAHLPGEYVEPRGSLLVARIDGKMVGCCALRPLDNVDYSNACEMKRLYVRREFRKLGIGRQLVEAILERARVADYDNILLDTLSDMESARALYEDLGFEEIPPFYHNPIEGAHYLKAQLKGSPP